MPFVQLHAGILAKVHIASNRVKTLCGRPIRSKATEVETPQDRATICKACQLIEQEEKQFQRILRPSGQTKKKKARALS